MSFSAGRNQKAKLAADYNDLLKELASPKLKSIGCYTLGETIGKGSYGKVRLAQHQLTCRLVAIKQISKKHAPLMAREIHHHRQLHHPNIVSLYEILTTETYIFIVSEHCPNGDLLDALARTERKRFTEAHVKPWFTQLIHAIQYCHSLGIIHRDLKLENILLDEHNHVKICDFGFARQTDKNQMLKTFCGSLAYSAPEVIQRQNYSGPETDIWSLGVILYTLLAGELPFDDDCESVLQRKVISTDYIIPDYFSFQVTDLLHKILRRDPSDRISLQDILHHPWLQQQEEVNVPVPLRNIQQEQDMAHLLLKAGFNDNVVKEMKQSRVGMLGTLWTMLIKSATLSDNSCATQQHEQQQQTWIGSFKSWLNKSQQKSSLPIQQTHTVQQQHISSNTHTHQQQKPHHLNTVLPLTPIDLPTKEDTIINSSSTCSSTTADDEFDDDQSSIDSSPATSVDEEESEDDIHSITEKINQLQHHHQEPSLNDITAFHRVSPMPSRVDLLIPRSRYPTIDEQQRNNNNNNNLRNRLENKMIIEEEEEEE